MWALLDIRIGRANRVQFYVVFLVCGPVLYTLPLDHVYFSVPVVCVLSYVLVLVWVRRYRDTRSGPEGKNPLLAALGAVGLLIGALPILAVLIVLSAVLRSRGYAARKFFGAIMQGFAEDVLDPLVDVLFKGSAPAFTLYGLPPRGLNFLTMTYETYPENLKKRASKDARAHEAEAERQNEEESEGVEALVARQAGKAARRKRYLFTEEYNVDDV